MQCLHANKIIHRDLKPQNIFVCANQMIKVADLGESKQLNHTIQQVNTSIGTFGFMSPEVIKGADYSMKSDIYSLGALLYYMCTQGTTPDVTEAYKPIDEARFSPRLCTLVCQMLEKDPGKRPTIDLVYTECDPSAK